MDRWTDGQMDRWTDGQTDKQTGKPPLSRLFVIYNEFNREKKNNVKVTIKLSLTSSISFSQEISNSCQLFFIVTFLLKTDI